MNNLSHHKKRENKLAKKANFCPNTVAIIEDQLATSHHNTDQELYLNGLQEEAINTSLVDFYEILSEIRTRSNKKEIVICDIGASYCKMAFVAQAFFPEIKVISIEPVKERIDYAINILGTSKHTFINDYFKKAHIENNKIDYVFLYFPVGNALEIILNDIDLPIIAIEAHGQLINRLGHSYKKKIEFTKLIMPRHSPMSYLFSERSDSKELIALNELRSSSNDLLAVNDQRPWYADKHALEIYFDDEDKITIEFQNPPRTIIFNNNLKAINSCELDTKIQELIYIRRENKKVDGCFIRKIFVDGSFELSNGDIRKLPYDLSPKFRH